MQPGDLVAERFEIEALAGEGGMGAVYRARDRTTGGAVAVKVLHDTRVKQSVRFAREARLLEELEHPAIVRYVADGVTTLGRAYLAMEWLEGESLADRLEGTHLPILDAVDIARRVADALGFAHRRGVIHRDLKPSNLFLVDRRIQDVRVIDFGIARLPGQTVTDTGAMLGTVGYMAPEQARGEAGVDARADVFSLGAVLFRCLTGSAAFEGEDMLEVLLRLAEAEAPRVRERRPGVPAALDDLVARMLSRDPELRPRDGAAVLAELAAIEPAIRAAASQGTLDDRLIDAPPAPRVRRAAPPETADQSVGGTARAGRDSRGGTKTSPAGARSRRAMALVAAILVAASLAVVVWMRARADGGARVSGASAASSANAKCPATRCEPVGLPAPEAADVRDFALRAQAIAREMEPKAHLMALSTQAVRRGVVDLRREMITVMFYFPTPNGTPGDEFGYLHFFNDGLRLLVTRGGTSWTPPGEPLPEPRCSSRDLWAQALAKGLPDDAKASIQYSNMPGPTWLLNLPGIEHNYSFDESCTLSMPEEASPTSAATDEPQRYEVRVKNAGPQRVKQVVLEYRGGQHAIAVIEGGKAHDVTLDHPPMAIRFVDGRGRKVVDEQETAMSAALEITIDAEGAVEWNFLARPTARPAGRPVEITSE